MTAAKVDRMTVSKMTALQVHEKLMRALENDHLTAGASHELDYAQDLMEALDEELAEHRARSEPIPPPTHNGWLKTESIRGPSWRERHRTKRLHPKGESDL